MELINHTAHAGDATGEIAQHIKLIAVVNSEVGIDMPDQNRVDGSNAALGFGKKTVDSVLALLGIVETAIPNEKLHLRKDALRPLQVGAVVLGAVVAQQRAAIPAPGLQTFEPAWLIGT